MRLLRAFTSWLRELLAPEGPALDLAIFRISIAFVIALSSSVEVADHWAALPIAARTAPLGVGWLVPHLPITPEIVRVVRIALYLACFTAGIGLFARASFAVVALTLFYVLLPPQLGGAVFHDHHLLWFAILLPFAPCGDALSIDAWLARRRGHAPPTHGRAHGLPIRVAWILIGLVFFFPGVHKLAEAGFEWIASDNLRNQMWWKWAMDPSLVPSVRIDRYPWLMHAGAGATVLFELLFLPLVFWKRTRAFVVIAALLFHQATDYFMGVRFTVLFACYGVFVPWDAIVHRVRRLVTEPRLEPKRSLAPLAVAGAVLVAMTAIFGGMGAMQAYPFACYPTFQWIPSDRMPAMAIEIVDRDGHAHPLDRSAFAEPGPRGWALEWRLLGVYDSVDVERIDAWWSSIAPSVALRDARELRFYRTSISVDPDRRGEVLERELIYTRPP